MVNTYLDGKNNLQVLLLLQVAMTSYREYIFLILYFEFINARLLAA